MTALEARFRTRLGNFSLDFELSAPGRGVTGLFGPSGSGKTTALRCLAGLCRAGSGRISVNGEVWQDDSANVFVPAYQRGVGYVSQETDLFPHLSVRDNLKYGLRRVPTGTAVFEWSNAVEWLGLDQLLDLRSRRLLLVLRRVERVGPNSCRMSALARGQCEAMASRPTQKTAASQCS